MKTSLSTPVSRGSVREKSLKTHKIKTEFMKKNDDSALHAHFQEILFAARNRDLRPDHPFKIEIDSDHKHHSQTMVAALLAAGNTYQDSTKEIAKLREKTWRCRIVSGLLEGLFIDCTVVDHGIAVCLDAPNFTLFYHLKSLKKKLEKKLSHQFLRTISIEVYHAH